MSSGRQHLVFLNSFGPHFGPVWEKLQKVDVTQPILMKKGGPRGAQGRHSSRSHGRVNKKKREKVWNFGEKVWKSEKKQETKQSNKK